MRHPITPALLLLLVSFTPLAAELPNSEPPKPKSHRLADIEGWTVEVDERLFLDENKKFGETALRLLGNQLFQIAFLLPEDKVETLQKIRIHFDLTHGKLTSAQYHPSAEWLRNNGYSERLAKCVHIPDATRFADRDHQRIQPWMVLHELAHAYHDQFLEGGFERQEIKKAWKELLDSKKYEKTLHVNGHETRHYALTDHKEFFAEFTEAFFGANDFFPFNRGELKKDAPEIDRLIRHIWIVEKPRSSADTVSSEPRM